LAFGAIRAGAIISPLSTRMTEREICEFYEQVTPKVVFMDEDQLAKHEGLERLVGARFPLASLQTLRSAQYVAQDWDCGPDDAVGIIATSGSTARPKGVVFTHKSMLSYAAEFAIEEPFSGPGSRALALSPLSTSGGFVQLVEFVSLGAAIRFEAGFDAERALRLIVDEKINVFQGVPLFFERIAACPGFAEADLSNLKFTSVGGARVPRSLLDRWLEKGCLLRQIYGQTEAGGSLTIMTKRDALKYPDKAGRGGMFTEIRVIGEDGAFLPPNQLGQIVIRGPATMKGYWNDPEATARTIVDGWLRTGDLGTIDENGYLTFVDRMKDIIISGGLNISAAEVERVVSEYPGVLEVSVIGAADAKFGETPLAIIHATDGLAIDELIAHCNRNLSDYKIPRYVAIESSPLPRLATGKIAKPALRTKYLALVPTMPRVR
jgi:fatty-acyl-CoA synthase